MVKTLRRLVAVLVLGLTVFVSCLVQAEETGRKPRVKVAPAYPELARTLRLSGVVKIEVTIVPNGTVKGTRVIGGNPVLVQAALDAVKKWQFETAPSETKQIVEFEFVPR